jgi:hypothetical protein
VAVASRDDFVAVAIVSVVRAPAIASSENQSMRSSHAATSSMCGAIRAMRFANGLVLDFNTGRSPRSVALIAPAAAAPTTLWP